MSDTAEPFTLVMQEDIQDATGQAPWEGGNDASYILDDQRRPVVSDHAAFAAMSDEAKTVAVAELGDNGFKVKTFFVGFDQSDGDEDEPLVFQTMAGLPEESWYVDASDVAAGRRRPQGDGRALPGHHHQAGDRGHRSLIISPDVQSLPTGENEGEPLPHFRRRTAA